MTQEATKTPYFYILMRTDLASMNAGKAVAQGSHAAHQFQTIIQGHASDRPDSEYAKLYELWLTQGVGKDLGFGTAITLEVTGEQLESTIAAASSAGHIARVTHDPTYPISDGSITHLIPLNSCGFVFGDKDELYPILGNFKLMGLCGAAIHGKHR